MIVFIYAFWIVVYFYFWFELIYDLLGFFWLSFWCSLLLSLDRYIIYIDISSIFILRTLKLSLTIHHFLLLCKLHLLNQLLLIHLHLRLQVNHLHIRILSILIEHLPLVLLQPFLRMIIFRMNRPQATVELFLSVFQASVVYSCIVFVQRWQLLVPNRSFLKIAGKGSRSGGSGVRGLRSSLSSSCDRSHFLIFAFLVLLTVIAGPLIYLIQILQLILRVGDAGDLTHHFEQLLHIILLKGQSITILLLIVTLNDLPKLLKLGVIVKQKGVDRQKTVLLLSNPLLPFDQLDVLL